MNQRQTRALAGNDTASTPARSRVSLRTLVEVAEELARVYRLADRGRMEWAEATKRAFILSTQGKLIEAAVVEARLDALEATIDDAAQAP